MFWTFCSLFKMVFGTPLNNAFQQSNLDVTREFTRDLVVSVVKYRLIWPICRICPKHDLQTEFTCCSISTLISSQAPRFLTHDEGLIFESSTATEMPLTKPALRSHANTITSVLSAFYFNMSPCIQDRVSLRHASTRRIASALVTWSVGLKDRYKCESSA